MRMIFACSCPGTLPRAVAAYQQEFGDDVPESCTGRKALREFIPTAATSVAPYLRALADGHGRYAYYMEWDDAHVIAQYDLVKGVSTL